MKIQTRNGGTSPGSNGNSDKNSYEVKGQETYQFQVCCQLRIKMGPGASLLTLFVRDFPNLVIHSASLALVEGIKFLPGGIMVFNIIAITMVIRCISS